MYCTEEHGGNKRDKEISEYIKYISLSPREAVVKMFRQREDKEERGDKV